MSEVSLQCTGVVAVVGQLVTASVPKHVRMRLDSQLRRNRCRSTMREKPGAESGAPRSETNTNGDFALSR